MSNAAIKLKKSSVVGKVPGTGDLEFGEVAINYADGRLYYKNSSNVIKNFVDSDLIAQAITDANVLDSADVRNIFSGGTGISYNSGTGEFSIDSSSDVVFNSITTTDGLVVGGNLQVNGTTVTVNASDLNVTDNMIYMNAGESSGSPIASIDVGWAANVNDNGSYAHVGMFRDATDDTFKVFENYLPEPDAAVEINTGHASFQLAPFEARTLTGKYLGFDSDFSAKSTTDLTEGANLYYTKVRVDSDIVNLIDSAYINARVDAVTGTDSAQVVSIINDTVDATFINALTIDADTLGGQAGSYYLDYTNFTNTPNILDSANVTGLIDSAYINARVDAVAGGIDSAAIIGLIDSDYVKSRDTVQETSTTLSTTTQTAIGAWPTATYGGGKYLIQATSAGERHATELLITHNGTTAVATEYASVWTNTSLATYDVDISGSDFRILATGASATSTTYKILELHLI